MKLKTYQQTIDYLYSFVADRLSLKFSGEKGVSRTKYLLTLLGSPQEKLPVIHIAGTSGKGSTTFLISSLLQAHGFSVGHQVSPHLLDLRERFTVNNQLLPKSYVVQAINEIVPMIEKAKETAWGKLTFFEILVSFTFYIFWKKRVDFAVMETGLGGLYDGTNVVDNPDKLAVITRIGLDHQWILGRTYKAIAAQKAGIIKPGNTVISLIQKTEVNQVLTNVGQRQKAKLFLLGKNHYRPLTSNRWGNIFEFNFAGLKLHNFHTRLVGAYQVENTAIALAALLVLSKKYDFILDEKKIRDCCGQAIFPGRFEIFSRGRHDLIIDGAHNPQKMEALTTSLASIYPKQKFNFFVSFSRSKDQIPTLRGMLKYIIPLAKKIYLTSFVLSGQDSLHRSVDLEKIILLLKELKFMDYQIITNDQKTINGIINDSQNQFVITGSLYLISSIYKNLDIVK